MDKTQAQALKTLMKARKLVARSWVKRIEVIDGGTYAHYEWNKDKIVEGATKIRKDGHLAVPAYCMLGAVRKADGPGEAAAMKALRQAISVLFYGGRKRTGEAGIFKFNDRKSTTHAQVLQAFDKAIEMVSVDEEAASNA